MNFDGIIPEGYISRTEYLKGVRQACRAWNTCRRYYAGQKELTVSAADWRVIHAAITRPSLGARGFHLQFSDG